MANTFKTVTFAAEPASAGTPYTMYTVAGSTTTVVLGLRLTNIHTTSVSVEVELVSDTANRNGANNVANGTAFLAKDVVIPAKSSLDAGDLAFNTSSNVLKYYDGSAWQTITADTDVKTKVSSNDTTAGFLNGKLVAGDNVTFTEGNNGGNETLTIASVDNSVSMAIALG